jgi:hypothetical protein
MFLRLFNIMNSFFKAWLKTDFIWKLSRSDPASDPDLYRIFKIPHPDPDLDQA